MQILESLKENDYHDDYDGTYKKTKTIESLLEIYLAEAKASVIRAEALKELTQYMKGELGQINVVQKMDITKSIVQLQNDGVSGH